jgi:diguanylate cyclase (GGDEF)-like protein/PAS domain S-box-containing protein
VSRRDFNVTGFGWFGCGAENLDNVEILAQAELLTKSPAELMEILRECVAKTRALLHSLPDLVFVLDEEGQFLFYHTHAAAPALYLSPNLFLGKKHNEVMPPELCQKFEPAFECAKGGQASQYSYSLEMPDGCHWYSAYVTPWNVRGRFRGVVVVVREITEHVKMEHSLEEAAFTDEVTGLPNRRLFLDRLAQSVQRLARNSASGAVLYAIDIDRFRHVNEAADTTVGDAVLKEIGIRLRSVVGASNTVARLGADEFAVLVETSDDTEALRLSERLSEALARPFVVNSQSYTLTASIGIVLIKDAGADPSRLLRDVDLAMNKAKQAGGNKRVIFNEDLHRDAVQQIEIEKDLREALENEAIEVHYQPIFCLQDLRLCAVEALARWNHPTRGPIPPCDFITAAEESGLIQALDRFVCRTACRQVGEWLTAYPWLRERGFWVSVNFSPRHIAAPGFVDEIRQILEETGLDPRCLRVEVTESLVMGDPAQARQALEQLAALGVSACLDDFGKGYSALGYLLYLPFGVLKMDISFVHNVPGTRQAEGIVKTILELAENLDLDLVAEGVEKKEQAEFLRSVGCRFAQGFLFARPQPASGIAALLEREMKNQP